MAIAHPFDVDVKAFSAAYGEVRHSVNAGETAETRLKDSELRRSGLGLREQIALLAVSRISSQKRP